MRGAQALESHQDFDLSPARHQLDDLHLSTLRFPDPSKGINSGACFLGVFQG